MNLSLHVILGCGLLVAGQVDHDASLEEKSPGVGVARPSVFPDGTLYGYRPLRLSTALPEPNGDPGPPQPEAAPPRHHFDWPEVWGIAGAKLIPAGTRMAPNGNSYHPLFSQDVDLNVGLLPQKKLYLFMQTTFWGQRGTPGQTHGNLDFTKREFDLTVGAAWNYWGPLEVRAFGYAYNNLNRGTSPIVPSGYNDGIGFENRYYFATDDIYDIGRLAFVSVGYMPSKTLRGGDGEELQPGLFARAYLTRDLGVLNSYGFLDAQLICQKGYRARLVFTETGIAARPFPTFDGLEFRLGFMDTYDIDGDRNCGLGYFAIRFLY